MGMPEPGFTRPGQEPVFGEVESRAGLLSTARSGTVAEIVLRAAESHDVGGLPLCRGRPSEAHKSHSQTRRSRVLMFNVHDASGHLQDTKRDRKQGLDGWVLTLGRRQVIDSKKSGGEGGIRTPGTAFDRTTV